MNKNEAKNGTKTDIYKNFVKKYLFLNEKHHNGKIKVSLVYFRRRQEPYF